MVPGSLEPHLWGYRPRISLLHLGQALQQQKSKYPILNEFVKEVSTLAGVPIPASVSHCPIVCVYMCVYVCVFLSVCLSVCLYVSLSLSLSFTIFKHTHQEPILRATQYLPDIVRLQHKLYDAFHHRLDRKDARGMTISQFIKGRRNGEWGREVPS